MDFYPLAGEISVEYLMSSETKRVKPLSREQARKFAQMLIGRRNESIDVMREEMSADLPEDMAIHAIDDDLWDKICYHSEHDTHLALLPNGNCTDAGIDPTFPALAVYLPPLGKVYVESDDDNRSEHQFIFDNYPVA